MLKLSPEGRVCSFCGIVGGPHSKFAGGYGAMICAECIGKYHDIFSSKQRFAEIQRPPWEEMSKEELLEAFLVIVATADQVDGFLHDWAQLLKTRKLSWTQIGNALGVSRQAAWERFARSSRSRSADSEAS